MTKSLQQPEKSSTGGTTAQTATGLKHTASAQNPNATPAQPTAAAAGTKPGAQPAAYNAANVMKLPGMEKYAKASPAVAPRAANFAGPSGYGQTTMGFKSPTAAPVAATKQPTGPVPATAAAAPADTRVVSGGPTAAEKAKLAQRIAQAKDLAESLLAEFAADLDSDMNKRGMAESIPDVDHMHGGRGINLSVADNRDLLDRKWEIYGNYEEWSRDVDRVNSELLDDNADYTTTAGGQVVSINNKRFAAWSNRNGNGDLDIALAKKYSQQDVAEDEFDQYETGVMDEQEAVAAMFTRLARRGRDPIDMIANRFGWGTHELDDLAQANGFADSAEWLNSFEPGLAEAGACNHTMEGEMCPEHGLAECGMHESQIQESDAQLARLKLLALSK
jgi:hypothetical protein